MNFEFRIIELFQRIFAQSFLAQAFPDKIVTPLVLQLIKYYLKKNKFSFII